MGRSSELKSAENELCGQPGLMLLFTVLLQLLNSSLLFSIPIYSKELQNYYSISSNCVAILGLLQTTVSLSAPLASTLVQKFGYRLMCCVGGILTATGFIISAFAPHYDLLYFSFAFLSGAGYLLTSLVAEILPQVWFNGRRYLATSISRAALIGGYFIWTPIFTHAADTYTWKGASLLHGGILLNVIAVAQLLKRDHRPSIKKPLSDIPHLLLPLNSPPRRRLLAQEYSGSRQPLQRSPKISQKHVENGNGNPSSVYLKENSWNNKFKRFSLKLYTITGCGSSTCAYDIVLFVGCVVVLTGHSSSIAKLIIRADSLGIRSNQLSALMPIYISLGVISRVVFGYVGDVWLVNGIVFSGIGAALSGLFCIMSDAMTSFAEQCIFVILLGIVQAMYDGIWPAVFVDVYGRNWREFAVSVFVFCASLAKILSYVISEWLVSETDDLNTPFIVLGSFQIIAGGLIAAICLVKRFLSELQTTTGGKEQSDESLDSISVRRRTHPAPQSSLAMEDDEWRKRTGSSASQLKEFYPL